MAEYEIEADAVRHAIEDPDSIVPGHSGRRIVQKARNGYLLRVIIEGGDPIIVVTVYLARRDRYGV